MRVALSHVFIYLFYLHYIFVSGNVLLIVKAVPTALQQYSIRSYMTKNISKQKKKSRIYPISSFNKFYNSKEQVHSM